MDKGAANNSISLTPDAKQFRIYANFKILLGTVIILANSLKLKIKSEIH